MNNPGPWTIHESRLLQMRGVDREVVVFHHERFTTKHMPQDRLARRGKDADL